NSRRNGQPLDEMESAEPSTGKAFGKMPCRTQDEIVFELSGRSRARPLNGERKRIAWRQRNGVASTRKCNETFERVKAIGAASRNMQGQIDLRGCAFRENLGQGG